MTVTSYERHGFSNHRQVDTLFDRLFKLTKIKLCITDISFKFSHEFADADIRHQA